jgi:hypothetical protein
MSFRSALYVGAVFHHRLRPKPHHFRYRMFWLLLDLDEIDELGRQLRLFSRACFNATSFYDRDHGDGSDQSLRAQIEQHLACAGITAQVGTVDLLCMPRIFGYGFNPLSVFYCYARDGRLSALIYEVHNTFGERHTYVIPVTGDAAPVQQACDKNFYVSPFLDMDMAYDFRTTRPSDTLSVAIRGADGGGPLINTGLTAERQELTDVALFRLMLSHPFLTLKVIGAIHWHALRLWIKGIAARPHPAPREPAVTIVRTHSQAVSCPMKMIQAPRC